MTNLLQKTFQNKKVLVTGHTGFKGSWLCVWLKELGAEVIGYSLDSPTNPNNFDLLKLKDKLIDVRGDILNVEKLHRIIEDYRPEIIFHMAAQAIVLTGFANPKETFNINVQGTVNVLDSARHFPFIKTIVVVTSDKCYKDQDMLWGYRETDSLEGSDPYSASKSMAEIAVSSYQKSFYNNLTNTVIASVRAGNVIGGGDFADFRLVPDCMKSLLNRKPIVVRNPFSIRPWQHVLVPLSGYLVLAAHLQEYRHQYAEAWNFGPLEKRGITTKEVVEKIIDTWKEGSWKNLPQENPKKETNLLKLNWDKAAQRLNWQPAYSCEEAINSTVEWFKEYEKRNGDMYRFCVKQIEEYTAKSKIQKIQWALDI